MGRACERSAPGGGPVKGWSLGDLCPPLSQHVFAEVLRAQWEVGVALVERRHRDKGRTIDARRASVLVRGLGARGGAKCVARLHDVVPRLGKAGTQCRRVSELPHLCPTMRVAHAGMKRRQVGACGKLMLLRMGGLTKITRTRLIGRRTTLLPRAFTTFYNSDKQDTGV